MFFHTSRINIIPYVLSFFFLILQNYIYDFCLSDFGNGANMENWEEKYWKRIKKGVYLHLTLFYNSYTCFYMPLNKLAPQTSFWSNGPPAPPICSISNKASNFMQTFVLSYTSILCHYWNKFNMLANRII